MINREHKLSVVRQCELLGLARPGAYYEPRLVSAEDLALMRRIDELHMEHPFAGARMLRDILRSEGYFSFYNQRRPHRFLDGQTPDAIYFGRLPALQQAA